MREVFCVRQEKSDMYRKISDDECDPAYKMESMQDCEGTQCTGIWFAGPFGQVRLNETEQNPKIIALLIFMIFFGIVLIFPS